MFLFWGWRRRGPIKCHLLPEKTTTRGTRQRREVFVIRAEESRCVSGRRRSRRRKEERKRESGGDTPVSRFRRDVLRANGGKQNKRSPCVPLVFPRKAPRENTSEEEEVERETTRQDTGGEKGTSRQTAKEK